MPRYALLLRASGNRVFGESAFDLAIGELELFGARALEGSASAARTRIAGVDYLTVDLAQPIAPTELDVLANLSGLHALFEVDDHGRFRPLECTPRRVLDEDLVTIQRYAGKTNEAFTHLLLNLALASGEGAVERWLAGERLRLLDPVCGRGTTLNRAALHGIDAHGIEREQRDVAAYDTFVTTWLQDKRLKHTVQRATLRRGRATTAHRVTITYGASKDTSTHRVIDVVHDDSRFARDHLTARSVDLLVGDLPYGVQHGSTGSSGRARGPEAFLVEALPVWRDVLRPGAGVALSWNRRTLARARLVELASEAGLEVAGPEDDRFVHRVDRSITRDVLVGRRPPTTASGSS
ncbi:MAG: TRM11 family SAM-dependent methyltransferase [Acidimicrobiales bacterium]